MSNQSIEKRCQEKILIFDGAMGTMLQNINLTADDFGGESYEGCNEILNLTRPDVIEQIHDAYLEAGADIIETNTFGATSLVLAEYDLQDQTQEINRVAAECAKKISRKWSTSEWPRYVAGAIGPTTKTLSVTGGTTFAELTDSYYEQVVGLMQGQVDLLLLETAQDTLNVKAASLGIKRAFAELKRQIPIIISGTIEPMGTMLAGQSIESFYLSIEHLNPIAVGLNCATGPEFMKDHLRTLSGLATCFVSCYPNAGLPDEDGNYLETPEALAHKMSEFAEAGWINIAGGCCGTTPAHIQAMATAMQGIKPRQVALPHGPALSGIESIYVEADNRPLLVGERTNVIGSRKFKQLIVDGQYEEASEIARKQVKGGAQVIDICLADPDRDELDDMERFLQFVTKKVKVPLMIDSTDEQVIEMALTYTQGKSLVNSINLEEGEDRFAKVVPLLHRFGAAIVVGTIDEEGMAITGERKLEVARRSYQLLVDSYGVKPEDIVFDPLVFPVGTGDEQYIGSAGETIEGIRLIKQAFPETSIVLGISNVSFGLPLAGREILNSVYMYECTQAGLDYAMVNTERLERYASIPEEERELAKQLLYETDRGKYDQILAEFTAYYREKKVQTHSTKENLTLEERLAHYVVEGSKDGLIEDLQEALIQYDQPLDIINGPLMAGMDQVGKLFNENQLIVAEVLQSAEVMKASVNFLEPHMDKADTQSKGKILLATVKGDVHDIGKNLVEIILANNGFHVINLGIKVPPETLIASYRKEKPDLIGLSGLLVKSAQQMVLTAQDLRQAQIEVPMLVGGAALTRRFTETRIAPEYSGIVQYAKDAMHGLELANRLQTEEGREQIRQDQEEKRKAYAARKREPVSVQPVVKKMSEINREAPVYIPPDWNAHLFRDVPLSHIRPYINRQMLLGKHLGVKGNVAQQLAAGDEKVMDLHEKVEALLDECQQGGLIRPQGIYRFFPAQAKDDTIYLYDPEDQEKICAQFTFPRQSKSPYLCLADFLRPVSSGKMDVVGLMAVTAGLGVREQADWWKEKGDYLKSHMFQSIALETAEGFAERLHQMMRDRWGISDPLQMTMQERFAARYQGIRVSFGYPACPDLEQQEKLFHLLEPERIGIELTEGFMMEPEASVTAMVFSHPQARYFNAI